MRPFTPSISLIVCSLAWLPLTWTEADEADAPNGPRPNRAVEKAEETLKQHPDDPAIHYNGPRPNRAVEKAEETLKQHPDDPALHYNLGTLLYHQRHYDQAAEALSKALVASRASLRGQASYNLGNARYRLGQAQEATSPREAAALYRQALDGYRLSLRQDPHDRDARYNYELVEKHVKTLEAQQAEAEDTKARQASAEQTRGGGTPHDAQQEAAPSSSQTAQPSQDAQAASDTAGQPAERTQAPQQEAGQHATAHTADPREAFTPDSSASGEHAASDLPVPSETGRQTDQHELSTQQALWILDSLKREEQGARVKEQPGHARESAIEHDW